MRVFKYWIVIILIAGLFLMGVGTDCPTPQQGSKNYKKSQTKGLRGNKKPPRGVSVDKGSMTNWTMEEQAEIQKLKDQINLLNLINGLHLGEDQYGEILAVVQEFNSEKAKVVGEFGKQLDAQKYINDLSDLKEIVLKNGEVPNDLERGIGSVSGVAINKMYDFEQYAQTQTEKLYKVFDENQKRIIGEYEHCTIPKIDPANPSNIGGASNKKNQGLGKKLDKVRTMSEEQYTKSKSKMIDAMIDGQLKHHKIDRDDASIAKEKARLDGILEQLRTMDEEEFQAKQNDIVAELRINDSNKRMAGGDRFEQSQEYALRKLAKLFFFDGSEEILKAKISQLKATKKDLGY